MAKEYNVGDRLYLPVWVTDMETNVTMGPDKSVQTTDAKFYYAYWHGKTGEGKVRYGEPGLLLTAEEVADKIDLIARSTLDEYSEKAQRKIEALTKQLEEANETIKAFSESENIVRTNFDAKVDENRELKSRNAELEALLKEVMATRDEAIKQNNELIADRNNWKEASQRYHDNAKVADAATEELRKENGELKAKVTELSVENENLKSDCNEWKDTANERLNAVQTLSAERNKVMAGVDELKNTLVDRTNDVQHLTEENEKLKAELDQRNKDFDAMKKDRDNLLADNKRTTAYYMEANRTASEAAEANDDLKAKIADLRNRVGEQLAQIQDLNAEIHFHKEFGEGVAKQQEELQARYDELDSVNKEQAEKIRKLDKALTDLKQRNDALQDDNTNLNFLLEAQPEEDKKKSVHIVLNDGTEIEFKRKDIQVFYRTDIDILVINDGDEVIAGFDRGDNPTNFAYFFMG